MIIAESAKGLMFILWYISGRDNKEWSITKW